jgi:hypothetical protein
MGGGLNRSTQHFIFGEMECALMGQSFIEGLLQRRKRSYGIAGSAESR